MSSHVTIRVESAEVFDSTTGQPRPGERREATQPIAGYSSDRVWKALTRLINDNELVSLLADPESRPTDGRSTGEGPLL